MAAGLAGLTQITQHRSHPIDVYVGYLIGAGIGVYLVSWEKSAQDGVTHACGQSFLICLKAIIFFFIEFQHKKLLASHLGASFSSTVYLGVSMQHGYIFLLLLLIC